MFVYVGGIPGVGKTAVIKTTVKLAQLNNFPLSSLNEKKVLYQITCVSTPEGYANLPHEIRANARRQLVEYLYNLDAGEPSVRIRDDHFTAPMKDGTYWIRPLDSRDKEHMLAFVTIVAKPKLILQRRLARGLFYTEPSFLEFDKITHHQEMEIRVATQQAEQLQITFRSIENEEGKLEKTSILLFNFLKKVVQKRG